jgi:hypothetical protein
MKWGVRRSSPSASPGHPDAIRARKLGQTARVSGLKALSNEELQAYAHRIQLEQNVRRLTSNETSSGKKFVKNLISRSGNTLASDAVNKATKEIGKAAIALVVTSGITKIGRKAVRRVAMS